MSKESVQKLPKHRETILRGMMTVVAERLHDTVTRGTRTTEFPVILLESGAAWPAPYSFAVELARSLARQTSRETLVANLGCDAPESSLRQLDPLTCATDLAVPAAPEMIRADLAAKLTRWKQRFANIVLNPVGATGRAVVEHAHPFADHHGYLLGPGERIESLEGKHFAVQCMENPCLPALSGKAQLISDCAEAEKRFQSGQPATPRFLRTVDSIARCVADLQVGIALGGGAAWGWAHIGVLSVLEKAEMPLDVVAGCSMGTVIGSLRCAGLTLENIREIANYWRTRTRRFVEYRFWRMHLIREKTLRKVFGQYFGNRTVNQTDVPFWANAVDIQTGREFTIQDGPLVDAVRGSIALPGLLPPLARNGHLLVDAGILDPVPVRLARRMGCRFAIGVNAMAPLEAQPVNRHYPRNLVDIMFRCTRIMGHEIGQARAEAAADVMLIPPVREISMLEFDRSEQIIDCGRRVAEENLPQILAGYERLKAYVSPAGESMDLTH
jgi:NTE family protein